MIGFAYFAFIPALDHQVSLSAAGSVSAPFSWPSFAARVVLTITVGILAASARSQDDKGQDVERRNGKMALELDALGPYLAPLPLDKQREFRIAVGGRSFGKEDLPLLTRRSNLSKQLRNRRRGTSQAA